jgi:pimeloyl-ACP methyl ester carboxylesterase
MPIAEITVDVTEAVGLGEQLRTRATVVLPPADAIAEQAVVCFAFPGGGYSRGYFTFDMPGASGGGQAGWHARRGWIFVACDHLFVGDSDAPSDPTALTFERVVAANHATVEHVSTRLAEGTLVDGYPPTRGAVRLGIGQSMGGCFTVVQQGQLATFDGVGILGYSAIQTVLWMPPGTPEPPTAFVVRGSDVAVITESAMQVTTPQLAPGDDDLPLTAPGFHYDDVPRDIVEADLIGYPMNRRSTPAWASATMPPCAVTMLSPGVVAPEAASIRVPVLVAVGERDVVPDPHAEPRAYPRSRDVTVFECPRMAHMHNFAGTREQFWQRVHSWGDGVAAGAGAGGAG